MDQSATSSRMGAFARAWQPLPVRKGAQPLPVSDRSIFDRDFRLDTAQTVRSSVRVMASRLIETKVTSLPPPYWKEDLVEADLNGKTQVHYRPLSKGESTDAMIPRSVASELYEAIYNLQSRVGDIDDWMASRLQWTKEHLYKVLSAEQIDTAALAIHAADSAAEDKAKGLPSSASGGGVIIASMTGFGKGRVLATTCRAALLSGRNVVFMTLQENLFSDFWRDIRGIESEDLFGRPLLVNEGSTIVDVEDPDTPILVEPYSRKQVLQSINDKKLPDGCRMVMITHSQVNRPGTPRSDFLEAVAAGAHFALDEAHKGAGESNTRENIDRVRAKAASTTESSATFAADIANLTAYTNVMPWLKDIPKLSSLPRPTQIALSQISVREATSAGGIVRHELDMDGINTEIIKPSAEIIAFNEQISDSVAPVLSAMAVMARDVDALLKMKNMENADYCKTLPPSMRKAAKETWFTAPFGSRLSAIQNQILTALNVKLCAQVALDSLKNGEKPIAVIEATMESIMNQLRAGEIIGEDDQVLDPDPPTLKVALFRLADGLSSALHKYTPEGESERVEERIDISQEHDYLSEQLKRIKHLIGGIKDIPLYPIDEIREIVERHKTPDGRNYVVGEVSGRSLQIRDGKYVKNQINRNQVVARFNNGGVDMATFTKAASTGLSVHDKFKKSGRSHMIWVSLIGDVKEKRQMEGRCNRRGQRTKPRFSVLHTGLPYNTFVLTNGDRKEAKLDANLTGAETSGVTTGMPDPIDQIGEDVAREFLFLNRNIANQMGINLNVTVSVSEKELYFVNKLFRRLPLVSVSKANNIIKAFFAAYEDRLKYSINPNLVQSLKGNWKPVKSFILQPGDGSDHPLRGPDTTATIISKMVLKKPMRSTEVGKIVREARQRIRKDYNPQPYLQLLEKRRQKILENALDGEAHKSVHAALMAPRSNYVQVIQKRLNITAWFIEKALPGCGVILPDDMGVMQPHIILDIEHPEVSRVNVFRDYHITVLMPGASEPFVVSLDAIMRYSGARFMDENEARNSLLNQCNQAPEGEVPVFRTILDGNVTAAILDAHYLELGEAGTWIDQNSRINLSVLVPKSIEKHLTTVPVRIPLPEVGLELIRKNARLIIAESLSPKNDNISIVASKKAGFVEVSLPQKKKNLPLFASAAYQRLVIEPGNTKEYRERHPNKIISEDGFSSDDVREIKIEHLPELLHSLYQEGKLTFYADSSLRNEVIRLCNEHKARRVRRPTNQKELEMVDSDLDREKSFTNPATPFPSI